MAKILPLQYAKILYELTKDFKEKDLKKNVEAFVDLLKKNQNLNKISYIIKEFELYAQKTEGKEKAIIRSARPLSEKMLEEIKKSLELKGEIVTENDPEIIGGVIVKIGNKIFDASIKTQINKLKQKLI